VADPSSDSGAHYRRPEGVFERHGEGLEFDRAANFSDAVFAIAMTLLVVGIAVPELKHASDLPKAVGDLRPQILSFFISFVVIGYYWVAHHRFWSQLRGIDTVMLIMNLVYLAAIAFIPFPTALVGKYTDQPISVIMYASCVAVASFLEVLMFARARSIGALRHEIPDDVYRYGLFASLVPVVVFAIAIVIAFLATPTLALLSFLLTLPFEALLDRFVKPENAGQYF
jgi:TMEM175 potassium channel family protein